LDRKRKTRYNRRIYVPCICPVVLIFIIPAWKEKAMILQNVIFPKKDICDKDILYYRQEKGKTRRILEEGLSGKEVLVAEKGGICSFFTYFNGFSLVKWQEYTDIRDFQLHVYLKGKGKVYLCHSRLKDEDVAEKIIEEKSFGSSGSPNATEVVFNITKDIHGGIIFFKLLAEEETVFYSGFYNTLQEAANKINIAAGICTYRREQYINKTLEVLSDAFFNNITSLLYGSLKIYVSDNGNTLDCTDISNKFIKCVYNKNAGGTGGFTRCIIEALKEQDKKKYTHFIFMDDDILLEPESIYRTYTLLSMANKKYKSASIGGALLRTDFMEIQHACGEDWNGGRYISPKEGYDLSRKYYLLANEKIIPEEYNGWWYCCIPFSQDLSTDLPLPVFIHRDDVEYNIRRVKGIMHLNGINVWHDTFENRRASNLEYYNTRNLFIVNSIHSPGYNWRQAQKHLFVHMAGQLLKYHYKNKELLVKAVKDFCKGPEFLKKQEPVALHQDIMKMGYKLEDVTAKLDKYNKNWKQAGTSKDLLYKREKFRLHHIVFLNGWLLPAKRKPAVFPVGVFMGRLFRVKNVLFYEPDTGRGYICRRSYKELFQFLKSMYLIHRIMRKSYDKAAEDYRRHYKELTSLDFWKDYLDLKD